MSSDATDSGQTPAPLALDIVVEDVAWPEAVTNDAFAAAIAAEVARHIEFETPERAALAFADDAHVQRLNLQYLGKDKPTNVLSFPAHRPPIGDAQGIDTVDSDDEFISDIILAPETVEREAAEQGLAFEHHVTHLMVHGILHLLGYDHERTDSAEEMEALEIDIFAGLGVPNPYTEELVDAGR